MTKLSNLFIKMKNYWGSFFRYSQYPEGVKFPLKYHIRWIVKRIPKIGFDIPCHIVSLSGAKHYLSSDPLDERVTGDMLGISKNIYFPSSIEPILKHFDGWALDIGAFNGSWAIELLSLYPGLKAILLEPNHEKIQNINAALLINKLSHRTRVLEAGLGSENGRGWLVESSSGSWGNWLQREKPTQENASEEVVMTTLDKALNGVQSVVVKCNAEGAEFELVRQLLAIGIRPKLLILMVHPEFGDIGLLRNNLVSNGFSVEVVREYAERPIWHVYSR